MISNKKNIMTSCLLFLIIAATITVYWQVNNYDFVNLDDGDYVNKNPMVLQGLTINSLKWAFTTFQAANWHPITWLSHMLDTTLYHGNPGGHHWTSVQIHVVNTVLLFFIFKWMTGMHLQSLLVAALFALHPLHVESVAWISERKDVLSTFFMILSLWAYIGYARHPGAVRYFLLIGLFSLGLMAKPMLVTFPFLLLLLDYWPLKRYKISNSVHKEPKRSHLGTLIVEKIPLLLISFTSSMITYTAQNASGAVFNLSALPLNDRLANAVVSYARYLIKMVWPSDLSCIYPLQAWPVSMVIGSGALMLFLTVLMITGFKRYPYLMIGWFWYLGTLVPVIGFIQVGNQSIADRYTYIPLIGIFIMIAWGWADLIAAWRKRKVISGIVWGIILIALSICSWFQISHWKDGMTLFSHAVNVTEDNWLAHGYLGKVLISDKKNNEVAIRHLERSLEINPFYADAYNSLGSIFIRRKKYEKGILYHRKALRLDPDRAATIYQIASAYQQIGKIEESIILYKKALTIKPELIGPIYNLAWIMATSENARLRNGKKAVILAEKLSRLSINPQPLVQDVLSAAYAENGEYVKAIQIVENAISLSISQKQHKLAEALQLRLKMYLDGKPYRQSSSKTIAMLEQFGEDIDIIKYSIQPD